MTPRRPRRVHLRLISHSRHLEFSLQVFYSFDLPTCLLCPASTSKSFPFLIFFHLICLGLSFPMSLYINTCFFFFYFHSVYLVIFFFSFNTTFFLTPSTVTSLFSLFPTIYIKYSFFFPPSISNSFFLSQH